MITLLRSKTQQFPIPNQCKANSYKCGSLLQSCIQKGYDTTRKSLHCEITKKGNCLDLLANNVLLNLYADAANLFGEMPDKYTASFVTLTQGYSQRFRFYNAIGLFWTFHGDACAFLGASLIDCYSVCGNAECARQVSDATECKDMVSWTGMMRIVGFKPNDFTFASAKTSYVEELIFGSELIDFYIKSGDVGDALRVFEEMPKVDFIITWYAQSEQSEEIIELLCKMRQGLELPHQFTLASLLQTFVSLVKSISHVVKTQMYLYPNSLMDMNAKYGRMENSMQQLVEFPNCTDLSWNREIVGYVQA
uniref:Pentatricopeptide repeat-containing protein n=1 Tax=Salix viminalis TaxID=40686 RepID=A0A6N2M4G9_SALVM